MSLDDVVTYIAQTVANRAAEGKNYGTVLIPEGIIEFIPAIKKLIAELNEVLQTQQQVSHVNLPMQKNRLHS